MMRFCQNDDEGVSICLYTMKMITPCALKIMFKKAHEYIEGGGKPHLSSSSKTLNYCVFDCVQNFMLSRFVICISLNPFSEFGDPCIHTRPVPVATSNAPAINSG
jgi:hypothetical protein